MLFVPPSMPFMDPVPEAEAAPMDSPADAITDLSLVSISKKNNRSDRNSITLSWSAPNDNGSPIVFYHVQVHSVSGSGWVTLENNHYDTTYTHDNGDQGVATGYQYSYRVFAIAADGCNGNTSNFVDNCNESNILHVVSLPDAAGSPSGIATPISQCNNSDLNDCGWFAQSYYLVNLSFESLNITSSGGSMPMSPGETLQITPTVKWDWSEWNTVPASQLAVLSFNTHGEIKFPDGTILLPAQFSHLHHHLTTGINYSSWAFGGPSDLTTEDETFTLSTWNEQLYSMPNGYFGDPWPVGEYTVTFTVDTTGQVSESSESDNVITGTFTVAAPADTTPPVVTVPDDIVAFVSLQGISSKTISWLAANVNATDNVGVTSITCQPPDGSTFPLGTTTVTCTATDAAGNSGTGTFTVTICCDDTTPPVITVPSAQTYVTNNATEIGMGGTSYYYGSVTATDDSAPFVATSCSPQSGSFFTFGTTTVTCTASDAAGNVTTGTFTVTVVLESADTPTPTVAATAYLNGTSPTGRTLHLTVNDTDGIGTLNAIIRMPDGSFFQPGAYPCGSFCLRMWDGTNAYFPIPEDWESGSYEIVWLMGWSGEAATTTAVTIPALPSDTTAPQAELTMNSPNISEFDNFGNWAEPKVKYNPTGSFDFDDFWDNNNVSSCLSVQVLKPDGTAASITYDTACVQHFAYNYNFEGFINDAFNASGWTMTICNTNLPTGYSVCVEQNFTINFAFLDADTTLPVINFYGAAESGNVTLSCSPQSSCSATGAVTTLNYQTREIEFTSQTDVVKYWDVTAQDDVGIASGPTCNILGAQFTSIYGDADQNVTFPIGTTIVTCSATDAAGNVGTRSFIVTVTVEGSTDTTPPVFGSLEYRDESYEIHGANLVDKWPMSGAGDTIVWTVTATDNVGVVSGPTCNPPPSTSWETRFPVGDTTVTCTASDAAGNGVTAIFTVTIWPCCDGIDPNAGDTTPPVINFGGFNENDILTRTALNSTGYNLRWHVNVYDAGDTTVNAPTCYVNLGPVTPVATSFNTYSSSGVATQYGTYEYNHLFTMTAPGGGHTVLCEIDDDAGNHTEASFVVRVDISESFDPPPLTVAATAYLNATSPTGRTLKVTADICEYPHCPSDQDGVVNLQAWIRMPDGSLFGSFNQSVFWFGNEGQWTVFYFPIPEDWVAGSYDVIWSNNCSWCGPVFDVVTAVTIPALTSYTTPPPQNHDVVASHGSWANTDIDNIFTPDTLTINVGDTVTWLYSGPGSIRVWGSFVPICSGQMCTIIGNDYPPYTHTFNQVGTYEYTDHGKGWCQNLSTAFLDPTVCPNGTIIVVDPTPTGDTTPPVVTVPSNISVSTPSSSGITVTFTAASADNMSNAFTSCNPLSGSLFPIGTTTVSCVAVDSAGNLGSASFTVTITYSAALPKVVAYYPPGSDTDLFTPDVLTINVGDTVTWLFDSSNYVGSVRVYGSFTAGECNYAVSNFCSIGHNYPPYTHTFNQVGTYEYTDWGNGWCQNLSNVNHATCPIGTIIVVESGAAPPSADNILPVFTTIPNVNLSANNSTGVSHFYTLPTATDNVGVASGPTCTPSSGSNFPVGTTTVTCTATDFAGNVATASFTVTVIGPTIVQNALGSSTPGCEDTSSCFTPYQATIPVGGIVLWENVDNAAHTATSGTPGAGPSGHFDSELMMAGGSFSHTFDQEGTWYYFCMVHPWMIGKVVVGDGTPIQTTVPVGAEEAEESIDITPPTVGFTYGFTWDEGTDDIITRTALNSTGYNFNWHTSANDNESGIVDRTCNVNGELVSANIEDDGHGHNTPSPNAFVTSTGNWYYNYLFPINSNTVTCTATDAAGNVGAASFTVIIIFTGTEEAPEEEPEPTVDTTPPNLVVSNNIYAQTTDPNGRNVYYASPSATDNVGVMIGPTCTPESGDFFTIGTTTVICTAYDEAVNQTVKSFTVTVTYSTIADITSPVFALVSSVDKYTTNPEGIVYHYAIPQVSDNIGVTIGPTCNPSSGSLLPIGITTIICTASDAAGNQGSIYFTVTVVNPNATGGVPIFGPVDDISEEADVPNGKMVLFTMPTATDDETESPFVSCTPSSGTFFPVGDTPVVCTAIDEDGNQGSVTFNVGISSFTQQLTSDQTADTSITAVKIQQTVGGASVPSVPAGGLAYFTTSLATNSTGNAFVTISVQDADLTALGVGHFKSVIGMGDSDITLGFRMPSDAISGTADIYVNVWTDETDAAVLISTYPTASIEIIALDPSTDNLGDFFVALTGFPNYGGFTYDATPDGYSSVDIAFNAIEYWKGSPDAYLIEYIAPQADMPYGTLQPDTFNMWHEDCPHCLGHSINSYAESKVPFGDDFFTDLEFNYVSSLDAANLQIHWVIEFTDTALGHAPLSTQEDLQMDVIYLEIGNTDDYGSWQPWSTDYLIDIMAHELGHVIGFAHDGNPNSLMYGGEGAATGAPKINPEYGTVELTKEIVGGGSWSITAFTSRDATNFNYHVSTDNEAGFNVYFVPDLETAEAQYESSQQIDSYPGCFVEDVMSTGTLSCNNVEMGSGLFITVPLTGETEGVLSEITIKLQENFGGMQTLSNVATTQEAPIMTTAVQSTKFELLEVFEAEAKYESVFLDGTDYLEITDTTLTQDIDEFSIVGWIKPDFSKASQELTIISKEDSFALYLEKESFQLQGGHTIIVPNRTINFSVYDGVEWYTITGNTEIVEGWHHIAAVVDGSVATLYLDTKLEGKMKLEKKVILGKGFIDTKMSVSDADLVIGAYISKMMVTNQYDWLEPKRTVENIFSGGVSSLEIFSDAFTAKQVFGLYERDKNYYQRDSATDIATIGSESPALSDSECLDLAKERGLFVYSKPITVVCKFPFNVVIPLNSSILWMETLPSYAGPYHAIRSVDDLFKPGAASFALIDFYEPNFTYSVYEYFDELNGSLTGKIIIAQPLLAEEIGKNWNSATQSFTVEPIKISRHSAGPDCAIDDSCYEPFAVSVDVREEITWKNTDGFSHSVTSGTPEDGPDGVFDSGLIPPMRYFSHTFSAAGAEDYSSWRGEGIYDYYCTFHPWMKGMIVVGEI